MISDFNFTCHCDSFCSHLFLSLNRELFLAPCNLPQLMGKSKLDLNSPPSECWDYRHVLLICSTGNQTQGLVCARQAHHELSYTPNPIARP